MFAFFTTLSHFVVKYNFPPSLLCFSTYLCVCLCVFCCLEIRILAARDILLPEAVALLFRRRAALRETLEPAERVVDEDPILEDLTLGRRMGGCKRDFQRHVRELVKVGRVVDGAHLDGDGGRPFADVLPVDAPEERHQLQVLDAALGAEPGRCELSFKYFLFNFYSEHFSLKSFR